MNQKRVLKHKWRETKPLSILILLALEKIGYKSVALKQEIVSKETKDVTADAIVTFVI
jgi:acyl-CoA thioesterase FadM